MSDLRSIFILIFLLPAVSLGQTIHKEKDKILYKGKVKLQGSTDGYNQSKSFLLYNAIPDSIIEERSNKKISSVNVVKLPSSYHLQKFLRYKIRLEPDGDTIHYEIDGVQLILHERGEKEKILSSEELLKGMDESGNTARDAEKVLNEIDMYIEAFIVKMQSTFSSSDP